MGAERLFEISAQHVGAPNPQVGRFLADVPDGHTPAMRHAMPFMLCVGSHSTPPTPALMSDGGQARDASQEGLGMWADREGTAVRFLLPGLLQLWLARSASWSDPCNKATVTMVDFFPAECVHLSLVCKVHNFLVFVEVDMVKHSCSVQQNPTFVV
eukprot:scaffold1505_cov19-Tisochrysis_lutea.AAC.1